MSINLDDLDTRQTVRRDRWGRYLVVPPGGGKPVGYTRATTVADTLSDKENLFPWSQVMAMTGLMRRPGLRGRFEALMSEHPLSGPWYGGDDAKAECKKIAAECKEAGGASDRADLGTSRHTIIEQVHRGKAPLITQADTQADIDAYTSTIEAAGLIVDPTLVESIVVHDRWQIAGTADMLRITVPGVGDVVGDLKTGTTLDFSHGSIAQQLAIYANADNVYRQGAAKDGSQDERLTMPNVSKVRALVIHLPAGEARCDLYWVDIREGRRAVERAMWVREWRKRKDLFAPYEPPSTLDYDELMHRYKKLAAQDPVFEEKWAELNIPKGDLAAVNAALTMFERPKPLAETVAAVRAADPPKPAPVVDDEGGPADDDDINTCKTRFEVGMTSEQKAWVGAVVKQAIDANADFRVTVKATQRRADIYSALTKFVTSDYWDDTPGFDDMVRALLHGATGDDTVLASGTDLGNTIGSLRTDEAHTLRTLVDQLLDERQILVVDEATGSLRLKPAA